MQNQKELTKEQAQKRNRDLEELKLHRMRNEKYRYYEPNGVGEEFINAFASNDYFILFLSAANGVGKTALAANILSNLIFPHDENWYFRDNFFKNFPYLKRGRIITDSALVEKNVVNELKFWMPQGKYTTAKGGKHFESIWKTKTGFEFDIMTYDQDPDQFEGVTLGWAWFDEPPPDSILKATIARMRRGGIIIITATPISGSAHLYDMFASGELEVEVVLREGEEPVKVKRKVFHLTADVESACKEHGVRGHLEHEHIAQMVAEYPEDERQARIYGKFQHLVGIVYKRFSRLIHVIKPFSVNPRDFCVYHAIDPHPRNPDAALWVAVDKNGTKYVVDELYHKPLDHKDLAYRLKNKSSQYRVISMVGDPSMFITDQHQTRSLATMLADEGVTYNPASKARAASDKRIETALNYTEVNGMMVRKPELYIFETCQRLIFEIEHYRWDEWRGKTGENRDRKEKPVDKDDHEIENLGRILIQEPTFIAMPTNQSQGALGNDSFDPYAS